ncbi:MAG: PBECR2 nuclease fold domain-containing protein [Candidatus Woesearchaeota archaeon]|nr:PBECR2 nuclease fold domain-containing protein [Candidatus Woesearchaeota archaeon]
MHHIFAIIDISKRRIHLSRERWAHIQKHPEMSDQIEAIKETLQQPDEITNFSHDDSVRFYYKYYKENRTYLFISVKYLNGKGFIITSFYTDKVR